jgi:L-fuculose-phosphate aldolase
MICLVDGTGRQILPDPTSWQRSSEFLTHLAIYDNVPQAISVCHAHPCHAGAFAIKQLGLPERLIPEMEIFVGQVPVATYETPGSSAIAASIAPLAPQHQSILLGLHGLICWGTSVEDAYFKIEITDSYCRTVLLAMALPGMSAIPPEKIVDLMDRKKQMGLPDNRYHLNPSEFCKINPWEHLHGKKAD